MDLGERLDKWLLEQERELFGALLKASMNSSDPEVRGIAGRIFVAQAMRGEIVEQRKVGDDD